MKKLRILIFATIMLAILFIGNQALAVETNLEINSPSAYLIESKTGRVLYEKNANEKMYPASTTKIMTAILTLENVNDLQEKATVSYENVFTVPAGYSVDTLKVGEELTIEELLYALLVKSSNEAANVLADYIAGSTESFATMMNSKAVELGCTGTNFVNPNGIQDENHYSTAHDLALMSQYAMKNSTFRKMVNTVSHTLPATNKYDRADRNLGTTNDLINKKSKNYYEYAIGIKTGYTTQAKNCLVAGANKNGVELIAVLLGASKTDESGYSIRDKDAKTLFEYVYNNFTNKEMSKANETIVGKTNIKKATRETKNLELMTDKDINILVTNDKENENIEGKIELNENLKAPIAKNTIVGTITYEANNIEYKANLIAAEDVQKSNIIIAILGVILALVILFIIYIFMEKSRRKHKKNKKYRTSSYIYK